MDTDKPLSRAERRMKKKAGAAADKQRTGGTEAVFGQGRPSTAGRREQKRAESKALRWQRKR
jgi:hypothetical protein